MTPKLFVLDDNQIDAEIVRRALLICFPKARVKCFTHLEDIYGPILDERPDCLILDDFLEGRGLQRFHAGESLKLFDRLGMTGRIVVVSSLRIRGRANSLQSIGAAGYLCKDDILEVPDQLGATVRAVFDQRRREKPLVHGQDA